MSLPLEPWQRNECALLLMLYTDLWHGSKSKQGRSASPPKQHEQSFLLTCLAIQWICIRMQHEQSFLLTCLAIQWICIRMCMGGFSMSMNKPHALRLIEFVCVYSIVNWRCIREHLCPKSRMIKFIFKCTSLALKQKVGAGEGGRAHV